MKRPYPLLKSAIAAFALLLAASSPAQSYFTIGTGTGSNGTTAYPTPYNGWYWGMKAQYLYLASELTAAGMAAGPISALRYNATAINEVNNVPGAGGGINNFSIGIKHTSVASLPTTTGTSDWQTGFTTVFGPTLYTVVNGFNVHTFSTPFIWDGASNILIEVCSQNNGYATQGDGNASVQFSTGLAFNGSRTHRQDSPAFNCVTTSVTGNVPTSRPNIGFAWTSATACSGMPAAGTASAPAGACPSSSFNVTVTGGSSASGLTYQWESSANGVSYSNVSPGGTSATLSVTGFAANTWYRRITTCTASGLSATSGAAAVTLNQFYNCTCIPTTVNGCLSGDAILNVTLSSLSNPINNTSSTCLDGVSYSNFMSTVTPAIVTQGDAVPISVTVQYGGTEFAGAWIDYNHSGTFDASEFITLTGSSVPLGNPWIFNGTVNIPVTALTGTTAMRVRSSYNAAVAAGSACSNTYSYGECEDYLVTINAAVACSGAPTGGTTTGPSGVCTGATVALGVNGATLASGLTYQWQSSTDGVIYNDILTATSATYTSPSIAVNTWFRRRITCTASGLFDNSTPLMVVAGALVPSCYCVPVHIGCGNGDIVQVNFDAINNASTCGPTDYTPYPPSGGTTTNLIQGLTYPLSVTTGNATATILSVWIDWNRNGVFQTTEWQQISTNSAPGVASTINITVPAGASLGQTVMRIRSRFVGNQNGAGDACLAMGSGETEDYVVTILAPTPCVNPPIPGTASASAASVCAGTIVNFGVSGNSFGIGQTYQWQSSPDNGVTPWADIPGATFTSYSASITSPGYYRLREICSGGTPVFTNSVQVSLNAPTGCYCTVSVTTNCDESIGNVQFNTINNTSGCSSYTDYTAINTTVSPGLCYTITVANGGFAYTADQVGVWLDWNQNGLFTDAGEFTLLTNLGGLGASFTGVINVPGSAAPGSTRMRVRMVWNTPPIPCGSSGYGETEDYTVIIGPPLPCSPPLSVTATTTGPNSGDIAWTCPGCTGVYVEYGLPGFTPGTMGTIGGGIGIFGPLSTSPLSISGLLSNTTYAVYLRQDCGGGVWSPNTCSAAVFTTALTCGDTYTDLGGSASVYPNFSNQLTTICPNAPNSVVLVTFSSFDTETDFDPMYVFNGPSTASPMIASTNGVPLDIPNLAVNYGSGGWWGTTAPNNIGANQLLATNPSGCLTFHFVSDDIVQNPGWVASVSCLQLNSTCATAAPATCGSINFGFTGIGITNLPPNACPFNGPASTGGTNWWQYVAATDGEVTASACGLASWNTRLSAFHALPDCSNMECVGINDDTPGCSNGTSELRFPVTQGETYYVVVHGSGAAQGTYFISFTCSPSCGSPLANDNCVGAASLLPVLADGTAVPATYDNTCAYSDASPSCVGANPAQGMWFAFNTGSKDQMDLTLLLNSAQTPQYSATSMGYALYSGTCTALSASGELACATNGAGTTTLTGLTPGADYKLLISNSGGPGVQGSYGLLLEYRPDLDALVESITAPVGLQCGSTITPSVVVKNNGLLTLTTVRLHYHLDSDPDVDYTWTGTLAPGASTSIGLPALTGVATGNHTLYVRTGEPNLGLDEVPGNDENSSIFSNDGETVVVVINSDGFGSQTSWDILDAFFFPVASGGYTPPPPPPGFSLSVVNTLYGNNTLYTETHCLPTSFGNCYSMFLYDSFGDGMCCANGNGYWELHDVNGRLLLRDIFANTPNGFNSPSTTPASPSYVSGHEFCLPLGPAAINSDRCNVFTNTVQSKVFATFVPGVTDYQFEFSDPDAGFRRRIAVPRQWVAFSEMQTNPLIPGVVYFARVRVDQGSPGFFDDHFGAGCELGITSVPTCSQLINNLALVTHSCGVIRNFPSGDKLWAVPVPGATAYHFKFENAGEGYLRVVFRPNYVCILNWVSQPLVNGSTYQVSVESRTNGIWSGYCGSSCPVTILNVPGQAGRGADAMTADGTLQLWPNPVRDGQVNLLINGLVDDVQHITVDVYDLFGKRVRTEQFENGGEVFNTVLDLGRGVAAGMYQVNVTINGQTYTERLTVE